MQKRATIINISSDKSSEKILRRVFSDTNYQICSITPGMQTLRMCLTLHPELIFIDHEFPFCNASNLISALRSVTQTPIIILSAHSSELELVEFLSLGANDYLGRPFHSDVLIARTKASLRTRAVQAAGAPELSNGCLRLDLVRHAVFVANKAIAFTPKEFDLLQYFLINRGKMLTHREILRAVWGPAHSDDCIYLRVYIGQIRRKIENCSPHHSMIKSECGIGYRMELIANESSQPLFDEASISSFQSEEPLHVRRVQVGLSNHSQSM
jgi:two-component system, OmpR family, KDP operon response regulator KdpE